jgi:hypothetical protein
MIDQLLIERKEIKSLFKLISISLLTKRTEPSKLQEIYPTFDAQNMPKNANNEVFAGFIQSIKNFISQYTDNQSLNLGDRN